MKYSNAWLCSKTPCIAKTGTGRPFKLIMFTISHWKNGAMDEEYLFWDNQTFMKQIGLAQ